MNNSIYLINLAVQIENMAETRYTIDALHPYPRDRVHIHST